MNKGFYLKMAWGNIRKNRNIYLPYLLTAALMAALFYIQSSLSDMVRGSGMQGARSMVSILNASAPVTGIFSLIILFYVNSFIMKQRKREFGLYNVLGMEKRHLARLMGTEVLMMALVSLVFGIGGGALFSQLFFLIFYKVIRMKAELAMTIPVGAVMRTLILFGAAFLLVLFYDVISVIRTKPVELLKSASQGEREPKSHWFTAMTGTLALAGGYILAQSVETPMDAMTWFFLAALLVIIGTYGLFMAGSIVLLKWLKKKESFYYQPRNFISVSGMLYRMKQNAAGLAAICILSTMVMVTVGGSLCVFSGVSSGIRMEYPREYTQALAFSGKREPAEYGELLTSLKETVEEQAEKEGLTVENTLSYSCSNLVYRKTADGWQEEWGDYDNAPRRDELACFQFLTKEDYEANTGKKLNIQKGEVAVYESQEELVDGTLTLSGFSWKVEKIGESMEMAMAPGLSEFKKRVQVIFPDMEDLNDFSVECAERYKEYFGLSEDAGNFFLTCRYFFDVSGAEKVPENFLKSVGELWEAPEGVYISRMADRAEVEELRIQQYGTILFIGFFLALIFLAATVLIIYYKQVTEGYDDRKRFAIMQDIGLSQAEVKKTIHTQVLLVFFLPLGAAVLHMAMAFKALVKMMGMFSVYNVKLFTLCIGFTVIVFGLVYFLVYTVTARTYYKIVTS